MIKDSKIYVAGHTGLVGSAIVRCLKTKQYRNIICRSHEELDLTNQKDVENFFDTEKPEYVFLAAAMVGGIYANNEYPADFIMKNLQIQCNTIDNAYKHNVKKLMFLGSSCIYPKMCPQPIKEEYLLTGAIEKTNEAYALAKISGLRMCNFYNQQYKTNYIGVMPTNLYGQNDNFDYKNSHVPAALLRKMHEAKLNNEDFVQIWGTGKPLREFLHVDDMANACVFLMEEYNQSEFINLGTGVEVTIKELAETIKRVVGFRGELKFDETKPDGTPRKLLDVSKLNNLGWSYRIDLEEGMRQTYKWYLENESSIKK